MTVFRNNAEQRYEGLPQTQLTPRQLILLNITLDFLLDASRTKSLGQALSGNDPLDLMRMLAHQWDTGLSTLSGDLDYQHSAHLKPTVAALFVEGIKAALLSDPQLHDLPNDSQAIYAELVRYMAKNQPHHAAWCAARLWQRPLTLN